MSGQTLTPVNTGVQTADTALNAVIKYAIEPELEAYIIAQVPALGLPVLKQIMEGLLEALIEREAAILQTFLDFAIIDHQVSQEHQAVVDALKAWQAAHASGDPNVVKKSESDLVDAFGHLIHYDGS